jgi:SAM-dependent methyltransferase
LLACILLPLAGRKEEFSQRVLGAMAMIDLGTPATRRDVFHYAAFGAAAVALGAKPALAQTKAGPKLDVIYVPTPQALVDRMLEMAEVKPTDFVMDLGCGDGRMIVTAARKYGTRGYGVDINPERIDEANANAREAGVSDKVKFEIANLFDISMAKADVLTMYLLTEINLKLRPKILAEMKPGSRVVSHAFNMGEWAADGQDLVEGKQIFLWHVPARVQGTWKVEGETDSSLDLKQQFQMVMGTVTSNGKRSRVSGQLKGTEITLNVEGRSQAMVGRVDGNEIAGANWRARQT